MNKRAQKGGWRKAERHTIYPNQTGHRQVLLAISTKKVLSRDAQRPNIKASSPSDRAETADSATAGRRQTHSRWTGIQRWHVKRQWTIKHTSTRWFYLDVNKRKRKRKAGAKNIPILLAEQVTFGKEESRITKKKQRIKGRSGIVFQREKNFGLEKYLQGVTTAGMCEV